MNPRKTLIISLLVAVSFLFTSIVWAKPLEIGIVWMGKSSMTERIQASFTKEIKVLIPDVKIEFVHVKDIEGYAEVKRVVRRFEKEKDGMLLLRSNGSKWLSQNKTSIPTFIGATNNPEAIGSVKNMAKPEGTVTGVTYFVPHKTQFEIFKEVLPEMKSVLLLLQKGHASTAVDRAGSKKACQDLGIEYFEVEAAKEQDSIDGIRRLKGKISAIVIGTNNVNVENANNIVAAAGRIPVLAFTDKPVKNGALAGFVPNDQKRGKMLAQSVYEVLVEKKPVSQVPVKMDPKPTFMLNGKTAEKLGLDIPYEVIQFAEIIE